MTKKRTSRVVTISVAAISLGILVAPSALSISETPAGSIVLAETKGEKAKAKAETKAKNESAPAVARGKCPPGQTAMPGRGKAKSITCM
jgi:hypothetical protein